MNAEEIERAYQEAWRGGATPDYGAISTPFGFVEFFSDGSMTLNRTAADSEQREAIFTWLRSKGTSVH